MNVSIDNEISLTPFITLALDKISSTYSRAEQKALYSILKTSLEYTRDNLKDEADKIYALKDTLSSDELEKINFIAIYTSLDPINDSLLELEEDFKNKSDKESKILYSLIDELLDYMAQVTNAYSYIEGVIISNRLENAS
jgi:wyosine [tRNA(Phe)-imidazoG37] synthetase (radical SAM superfamily)